MMRLFHLTHLQGHVQAMLSYFQAAAQLSQGRMTLDAFIGVVRAHKKLVAAAFEDPAKPGVINTDLLV